MATKYQMTAAAAQRIAEKIRETGFPTSYGDVLEALNEEEFASPERAISDLIVALRDAPGGKTIIELIAQAAVAEAARSREKLRDLRSAFRGIGLVFEDDVRPEALKE